MAGGRLSPLQERRRSELGDLTRDAVAALRAEGLVADGLRTAPAFAELRMGDGSDVCIVDLVAEPLPPIEPPQSAEVQGARIAVDTRHEILVNKLTALLSRSELRDLQDVKALLDAGGDLEQALADAPAKDAGFSVLTLAWVLKSFERPRCWLPCPTRAQPRPGSSSSPTRVGFGRPPRVSLMPVSGEPRLRRLRARPNFRKKGNPSFGIPGPLVRLSGRSESSTCPGGEP
jgi:hypothetical protein